MDIAGITTVYNGLKATKDIISGLSELKIEAEAIGKINEAVRNVGEAQDLLFQLREELFRLQEQNKQLKDEIASFESWDNKLNDYELVETAGSAVVYQYKSEPKHYICPNCVSKKSIQILQNNRTASGKFRCINCEGEYPINPSERVKVKLPPPSWPA